MVSNCQKPPCYGAKLGLAMPPIENYPPSPHDLRQKTHMNSSHTAAMLPYGSLSIENIPDSIAISDCPSVSMFSAPKKSSQQTTCVPLCSPKRELCRVGENGRNASNVSGFGAEINTLSNFDLEFALLEQALRKDSGTAVPQDQSNSQARLDKRSSSGLLESEFFFPDILGDNNMGGEEFSTAVRCNDSIHDSARFIAFSEDTVARSRKENKQSVTDGMGNATADPDFSTALASFVGSDVSTDFQTTESERYCTKEQVLTSLSNYSGDGTSFSFRNSQLPEFAVDKLSPNFDTVFAAQLRNRAEHIKKNWYEGEKASFEKSEDPERNLRSSMNEKDMEAEKAALIYSPGSDSSMTALEIGSHPDLYANLSEDIRKKVDRLQDKISAMPRRKLRESLAKGVTIEDVEPLMCVNRDELADMLGLGVTTWKMFVHHTLGIPRWPARALKSQKVKENKLLQKKMEAEQRGEYDVAQRLQKELDRLTQAHLRRRKLFRSDAQLRVSKTPIRKKSGGHCDTGGRN